MIKSDVYKQQHTPNIEALARAMGYEWDGTHFVKNVYEAPHRGGKRVLPADFSERVKRSWITRRKNAEARGVSSQGRRKGVFLDWGNIRNIEAGARVDITDTVHANRITTRSLHNRIGAANFKERHVYKTQKSFFLKREDGKLYICRYK